MIYFVKGRDEEIISSLNDLMKAVSCRFECMEVCVNSTDISKAHGYVLCEIADAYRCIHFGVSPSRIVGIGYSKSSYYGKPHIDGLHRHYVTNKAYNSKAIPVPFGYSNGTGIKELNIPRVIGIHSDFMPPRLNDLDGYSYLEEPNGNNGVYDVLVYASHNDRNSRSVRHAIACGIPIIGYTSIPLISELVKEGLAFELDERDDFKNVISNTIHYIGSNPQWQLMNSIALFKYAQTSMNWDQWIYELERL
jgi:hypothetical protein